MMRHLLKKKNNNNETLNTYTDIKR